MAEQAAPKEKLEEQTVRDFQEAWNAARAMPPGPEREERLTKLKSAYTLMRENFDPPGSMQKPLDIALDWGLRVSDWPSGLLRGAAGTMAGQYKSGDLERILKGQAPSGGEYLERMGVPKGDPIESLPFDPYPRTLAGMALDTLLSPAGLGMARNIRRALKALPKAAGPAPATLGTKPAVEMLREKMTPTPKLTAPQKAKAAVGKVFSPLGTDLMDATGTRIYKSAFGPEDLAAKQSFVMPLSEQAAERGFPILSTKGKENLVEEIFKEYSPRKQALLNQLARGAVDQNVPYKELLRPTGTPFGMTPSTMTKPVTGGGFGMREVTKDLLAQEHIPGKGLAAKATRKFLKDEGSLAGSTGTARIAAGKAKVVENPKSGKEFVVPAGKTGEFKRLVESGVKPRDIPYALKMEDYLTQAALGGYDIQEVSQIADAWQKIAKAKGGYAPGASMTGSPVRNTKNIIAGQQMAETAKDLAYNARRTEELVADEISRQMQAGAKLTGQATPERFFGGELFQMNQRLGGAAAAKPEVAKQLKQPLLERTRGKLPSIGAGSAIGLLSSNPWLGVGAFGATLGAFSNTGRTALGKGLKLTAPAAGLVRPALLEIQSEKRRGKDPWTLLDEDILNYAPPKR